MARSTALTIAVVLAVACLAAGQGYDTPSPTPKPASTYAYSPPAVVYSPPIVYSPPPVVYSPPPVVYSPPPAVYSPPPAPPSYYPPVGYYQYIDYTKPQPAGLQKWQYDCLNYTNYARSLHGAPYLYFNESLKAGTGAYVKLIGEQNTYYPLVAADTIEYYYQNYTGTYDAYTAVPYGHTKYDKAYVGAYDVYNPDLTNPAQAWYEQGSTSYPYGTPDAYVYNPVYANYTQLIWKASTGYWISRYTNQETKTTYWYARYWPAGNIKGLYQDNVLPVTLPGTTG